jgi:hypothetical protein
VLLPETAIVTRTTTLLALTATGPVRAPDTPEKETSTGVPTTGDAGLSEIENVSVFVLFDCTFDVDAAAGGPTLPVSKNNDPEIVDDVGP